jgi:hypothetical protein
LQRDDARHISALLKCVTLDELPATLLPAAAMRAELTSLEKKTGEIELGFGSKLQRDRKQDSLRHFILQSEHLMASNIVDNSASNIRKSHRTAIAMHVLNAARCLLDSQLLSRELPSVEDVLPAYFETADVVCAPDLFHFFSDFQEYFFQNDAAFLVNGRVDIGIYTRAALPLVADAALSSRNDGIQPKLEELMHRKAAIDLKLHRKQWPPSPKSRRRFLRSGAVPLSLFRTLSSRLSLMKTLSLG